MYPINTLKQSFLGVLTLKGPTLAWNNPFIALALMDPKMCTIFYPGTKNIPLQLAPHVTENQEALPRKSSGMHKVQILKGSQVVAHAGGAVTIFLRGNDDLWLRKRAF